MSFNFVSKLLSATRFVASSVAQSNKFHSLAPVASTTAPNAGGAWSLISVRTNVRNHFPKPREVKRVLVHGWHKRISTKGGRLIIMRRILKGKMVLTH